jgi:micrococcal nuclease
VIEAATLLLSCIAIDGDTLRCEGERYRLLAIDAPEMPGHCRKGRACVAGDPRESRTHLARLIDGNPVALTIIGRDRYRRPLVIAWARNINLSCAQIGSGYAAYVEKWDNGRRIASACSRVKLSP